MLPFLKNKQEGSMSSEVEGQESLGMLEAVAQDMMEAVEKKDKDLLKQALEALCEYVREEDMEQDQK